MSYKHQIEQALFQLNLQIVAIDENKAWWDDENWLVNYKYDSTFCLFICFIVDPLFEGTRKKGQGLYEIKATTKFPSNWNDDTNTIAKIHLAKGRFDIKLKEFISKIENHQQ